MPAEPAFLREVEVKHQLGDDLLVVAARERAGRAQANDVIFCARHERRTLVAIVGQKKPPPKTAQVDRRCRSAKPPTP